MSDRHVIFQSVFGSDWDRLPPVLRKHYANRAHTSDRVTVEGLMTVELSRLARWLGPLMKLTGTLVPYGGDNVAVTVHFESSPTDNAFRFNRIFHFPGKAPYHFRSRMVSAGGDLVVEHMRGGIGWCASYRFDGGMVRMTHRGYRWFGMKLPIEWLVGKGNAQEEAIDDNRFRMHMDIRHKLWGTLYAYSGEFTITEMRLDE